MVKMRALKKMQKREGEGEKWGGKMGVGEGVT